MWQNMRKEISWWTRAIAIWENYFLWNPEENVKKLYGSFNIKSEERRKPKITKWGQKREKTVRWSEKGGGRLERISRKSNSVSDLKSTIYGILILHTV